MSLSDLASIGSLVSGIAVLTSLVFLYFQMRQTAEQVRQTEKNQMAAIRQGRTNRVVEMFMACTEPLVADAISKGNWGDVDITPTQLTQFENYTVAYINHVEDSFHQHEDGLLNDAAYEHFVRGLTLALATPGIRLALQSFLKRRDDAFSPFIENIMNSTPVEQRGDPVARWKQSIVALAVR